MDYNGSIKIKNNLLIFNHSKILRKYSLSNSILRKEILQTSLKDSKISKIKIITLLLGSYDLNAILGK